MKLDLSLRGKNTDSEYMRTRCLGEYFDLKELIRSWNKLHTNEGPTWDGIDGA
jgi:hypothetical protein